MRRFTVVLRGGIVLQVDGENIADFYDLKGMGGGFKVKITDMSWRKIRKKVPFNPENVTAVQFHERDIIAVFTEEW